MRDIDVLKLAVKEKRKEQGDGFLQRLAGGAERIWYVVDPDIIYPAMIYWIKERITSSKPPKDGTRIYYQTARRIDKQGFKYAVYSKEDTPPQFHQARMEALEVARLWYTKMLHDRVNDSMGLHILASDKYKL